MQNNKGLTPEEIIALFKAQDSEIKKLPIDTDGNIARIFLANDKYYKIRDAETLSIDRFHAYNKLSIAFGFASTLPDFYTKVCSIVEKIDGLFNSKTGYVELCAEASALKQSIFDNANSRFAQALYICTLFITEPDEKLSEWTKNHAEMKIRDWIKEGYGISDFLSLAVCFVPQYIELLKQNLPS